jgi:hypothetical protein
MWAHSSGLSFEETPKRIVRRRRSVEEKRRIVEETLEAGASVARVARRHAVNANQVFYWRKKYREAGCSLRNAPSLIRIRLALRRTAFALPIHCLHSWRACSYADIANRKTKNPPRTDPLPALTRHNPARGVTRRNERRGLSRWDRKNYLFCGSDSGGERAAAIYTLIGSAKVNGIDPEAYLRMYCPASPNIRSTASRSGCHGASQQAQKPKEVRWPKEERRREAFR